MEFEDQVGWEGGTSGEFNTKSVVRVLCGSREKMVWAKLVWGKGYVPSMLLSCGCCVKGSYLPEIDCKSRECLCYPD